MYAFTLSRCALLVLALAAGCAARRIPGTEIPDTSDTRSVLSSLESYRQAAERRDAKAVAGLASPRYFDNAGTPDPGDDLDFERLAKRLEDDYRRVVALRLDLSVKRIEVDGDRAAVYVFYDEHYRIATPAGEVAKQASDSHRMVLAREGATWRFLSGL